ncbi:hypothetical protein [Streptomyces sp. enrichment culture]
MSVGNEPTRTASFPWASAPPPMTTFPDGQRTVRRWKFGTSAFGSRTT